MNIQMNELHGIVICDIEFITNILIIKWLIVMNTKTTKSIGFHNQNENKGWLKSKSKSWNNKNKNKNMTHEEQKSNKILLQGRNENKTRLW